MCKLGAAVVYFVTSLFHERTFHTVTLIIISLFKMRLDRIVALKFYFATNGGLIKKK